MTPADTRPVKGETSRIDRRLQRLAERGGGKALLDTTGLAWRPGPRPPLWISRRFLADMVADLRYGEVVTAEACVRMAESLAGSDAARACLAAQAADERVHAELYGRYHDMLPVEGRVNPGLEEVYQRCLEWRGHPVALLLAFNVVLEGEALRLQKFLADRLSCPLFSALNRRILTDESRHVAFGHIYGAHGLAGLEAEERIAIFRWIWSLWWDCSGRVLGGLQGPTGRLLRAMQPGLETLWRRQSETLIRLGLIQRDEVAKAERP